MTIEHPVFPTTKRPSKKSPKQEYSCDICESSKSKLVKFFSLSAYTNHIHRHFKRTLRPVIDKPICCICGKRLQNNAGYNRHIRNVHINYRAFACDRCPMRFHIKSDLRDHMLSHDNIRNHICFKCGKRFRIREKLNRHLRTHENIRNFVCRICNKTFSRNDNFKKHLQIHTGEKPFQCLICDTAFLYKQILRTHIMTHGFQIPLPKSKGRRK